MLVHEEQGFRGRVDERSGLGLAVADMGLGLAALGNFKTQVAVDRKSVV